jgi:hypothetical protein
VTIDVLLHVFDGRTIVSADEINALYDVVVVANDVSPVITHLRTRRSKQFGQPT